MISEFPTVIKEKEVLEEEEESLLKSVKKPVSLKKKILTKVEIINKLIKQSS